MEPVQDGVWVPLCLCSQIWFPSISTQRIITQLHRCSCPWKGGVCHVREQLGFFQERLKRGPEAPARAGVKHSGLLQTALHVTGWDKSLRVLWQWLFCHYLLLQQNRSFPVQAQHPQGVLGTNFRFQPVSVAGMNPQKAAITSKCHVGCSHFSLLLRRLLSETPQSAAAPGVRTYCAMNPCCRSRSTLSAWLSCTLKRYVPNSTPEVE